MLNDDQWYYSHGWMTIINLQFGSLPKTELDCSFAWARYSSEPDHPASLAHADPLATMNSAHILLLVIISAHSPLIFPVFACSWLLLLLFVLGHTWLLIAPEVSHGWLIRSAWTESIISPVGSYCSIVTWWSILNRSWPATLDSSQTIKLPKNCCMQPLSKTLVIIFPILDCDWQSNN